MEQVHCPQWNYTQHRTVCSCGHGPSCPGLKLGDKPTESGPADYAAPQLMTTLDAGQRQAQEGTGVGMTTGRMHRRGTNDGAGVPALTEPTQVLRTITGKRSGKLLPDDGRTHEHYLDIPEEVYQRLAAGIKQAPRPSRRWWKRKRLRS